MYTNCFSSSKYKENSAKYFQKFHCHSQLEATLGVRDDKGEKLANYAALDDIVTSPKTGQQLVYPLTVG